MNRPNIILLTVDCWRGDHVGVNPRSTVDTPAIDRLARDSTYFSDAYTCGGWTKIAMTALMSSTYSSQFDFAAGKIDEQRPMLAESLQQQGYETAGFSTNMVCGAAQGFERGFDQFEDLRPDLGTSKSERLLAIRGVPRLAMHRPFRRGLSMLGLPLEPQYPTVDADGVVAGALEWLEQPHHEPYFLWLHFMDLHWPYKSAHRSKDWAEKDEMWIDRVEWRKLRNHRGRYHPGDERVERWKELYREETESFDQALAPLLDSLRDRDDWDHTHLVMTGDHGEEFYEHGTWGHSWNQLHREGANVPLIIRTAGSHSHRSVDTPVSHLDIAPTLLDLAGIQKPDGMIGESFSNELRGEDSTLRPVASEMHGHRNSTRYRLAITFNAYRYIYDGDRDRCSLFALDVDPDETDDVYDKDASVSRSFDQLRLAHVSTGLLDVLKTGLPAIGEDIIYDLDADPKVVERLRALGYLD